METKRNGDQFTLEVSLDEAEVIRQLAKSAAEIEQGEYDTQMDSGGESNDEVETRLLILDEISSQLQKVLFP